MLSSKISTLCLSMLVILSSIQAPLFSQSKKKTRPGETLYVPTKIEWISLVLQAHYSTTSISNDHDFTVNFIDSGDGETITCVIQTSKNTSARAVVREKQSIERIFNSEKISRNWNWLKLSFKESELN